MLFFLPVKPAIDVRYRKCKLEQGNNQKKCRRAEFTETRKSVVIDTVFDMSNKSMNQERLDY